MQKWNLRSTTSNVVLLNRFTDLIKKINAFNPPTRELEKEQCQARFELFKTLVSLFPKDEVAQFLIDSGSQTTAQNETPK